MKSSASLREEMPPAALTLTEAGGQFSRMSFTSSRVAPPLEKPVEVLMKSAPQSATMRHMCIFSSSVSRQHSIITLRIFPRVASRTARISFATSTQQPSLDHGEVYDHVYLVRAVLYRVGGLKGLDCARHVTVREADDRAYLQLITGIALCARDVAGAGCTRSRSYTLSPGRRAF